MRRKVMVAMTVFVLAVMISTVSFAEDVFVTKYGKRYHKENSRFIKGKDVEKLTREEAEARGYKASSEFLVDESSNTDKDVEKK